MYAFRCKNCGHLHSSEAACEADHPHACCVCGAGVTFGVGHEDFATAIVDPNLTQEQRVEMCKKLTSQATTKTVQADNWEVLHDATDERLTELELTRDQVCQHVPKPSPDQEEGKAPQHVAVVGAEAVVHKDSPLLSGRKHR